MALPRNTSNLTGKDQHLHFEARVQVENALGLTGKMDPNEIVDTKFFSQDPAVKPQSDMGIIKVDKDGIKEFKNSIYY